MDVKLALVILVLVSLAGQLVNADIYYDRFLERAKEVSGQKLKCSPGATSVKMVTVARMQKESSESESESEETLRTHMNSGIEEKKCLICVCSVDGTEEHCRGRPARNINECIRLEALKAEMDRGLPFEHDRILAYRIRRDYIWHYDEIPYEPRARCRRGTSYYTNNVHPHRSTIYDEVDRTSLLDYDSRTTCFSCVCSVHGRQVGCVARPLWYCDYYRVISRPGYISDRYYRLFKEERPAYLRSLSYRMRRRMDDGVYDLLDLGGDALCCDHPSGHRRNLHLQVRNKIRQLRRKVPRENILGDSPRGDYVDFIVNND